LSILWRQTNRSAENSLPRTQFVSMPAMPLLRVPFQHARKAGALESHGAQVARTASVAERMEEASRGCVARKVRIGILRRGFQTGQRPSPCGPHRACEAHSTITGRQSGSPGKSRVYLQHLPWLQAASGSQTLPGRQAGLPGDFARAQFRSKSSRPSACHLWAIDSTKGEQTGN